MPYLGNVPAEAYTNTVKNSFNGDGSTTAFTLSQPSTTNNLRVVVENVIQDPTVAYSVSGTTLTFTSAPPSGTANIYAVHLGPATMTAVPPSEINNATNFTDGITVDKAGGTVITADRASSDGTIIDLQKNGSSLGTVGTDYDAGIYVGGGTSALFYNQSTAGLIQPYSVTGGAVSDGVVDFGNASNRFKNLYLSGGVYLGGTGSANKLSDVETGSWTPTWARSSSNPTGITYNHNSGSYTKIGNKVFIQGSIYLSAWSGGSGYYQITGLPFTVSSGSAHDYSQILMTDTGNYSLSGGSTIVAAFANVNSTFIGLMGAGGGYNSSTGNFTPTSTYYVYFSGFYTTTS